MDEFYESDKMHVVFTKVSLGNVNVELFTDRDRARQHLRDQREVYRDVKGVTYDREDDLTIW